MFFLNPLHAKDGYKAGHKFQYPANTSLVASNGTARGSRIPSLIRTIWVGMQYFIIQYLIGMWNRGFFEKPIEEVCAKYMRRMRNYLGPANCGDDRHIRALHALGYMPLEIWSLPEGSAVNLRVPSYVVWNTCPEKIPDHLFYWLTNDIETMSSATTWLPSTSATTAKMYRTVFDDWAARTNPENAGFVQFQGHDFSFRGHSSPESAVTSGMGHLLSFAGTDTIPAIDLLEECYDADSDKELVGVSVPATEHSVMCVAAHAYAAGLPDQIDDTHPYLNFVLRKPPTAPTSGVVRLMTANDKLRLGELMLVEQLITETYPTGIVSLVMDTWCLWDVIDPECGILVFLKDKIVARDGTVVIRPDSGDPVKIMTGWNADEYAEHIVAGVKEYVTGNPMDPYKLFSKVEIWGLIECLDKIFGSTRSSLGFKQLDTHIGAIYGDSITLDRAEQICARLAAKGYASTNWVAGIGSFTYQGALTPDAIVTRDTHCFAVKSTWAEIIVDGRVQGIAIYKDPVTDSGMKKSAKGLLAVYKEGDDFVLKENATWEEVRNCAFIPVFKDGKLVTRQKFADIKERVRRAKLY